MVWGQQGQLGALVGKPKKQPSAGSSHSPFFGDAQRDVNLSLQPYLDAITQQRQQAEQDYARGVAQTRSAYTGFQHDLAPLGGQYDAQAQRIMGDLSQQTSQLAPYFSPQTDPSLLQGSGAEQGAASSLYGTIAAGGQELLSSDRMRNLGYQTSAQRQGGIDQVTLRNNYLSDLQDVLGQLRQRRLDTMAPVPSAIQQRQDELRQQHFSNQMARGDMRLKKQSVGATLKAAGAAQGYLGNYARDLARPPGKKKPSKRKGTK